MKLKLREEDVYNEVCFYEKSIKFFYANDVNIYIDENINQEYLEIQVIL